MGIKRRIDILRRRLHKSIEKNGLNSDITRSISLELDKLINEYYGQNKGRKYPEGSFMYEQYQRSYDELLKITGQFGEFPTVTGWNKYAKENNLLSHVSIQYIRGLNWHKIRDEIEFENNLKKV